ncbi:JmjC domain-containing protein [Micromonospora sp. RP3T]|uniref:JmjC domain-containing protein n=1 Tax=Micromonospora sp. RP3T TaxID=2135446 RepID=UPI003D7431DE
MTFVDIFGSPTEFATVLAREAVVRRQAMRCPPGDLLTVRDLDRLLRSRTIRAADIRIAAENTIIVPVEYTAVAESSGGVHAEYAVAERVYRYFEAGATLIWPHLQRFVPALFDLARDVAAAVGTPTWVDGCLTPAGRMDLVVHDRPVEIAIVQLTGTRRWRVWPTKPQHADTSRVGASGEPAVDVTLEPGDVLYVPSHSPYVGDYGGNLSLHVSVTFRQPTWRNLMTDLVADLLLDDAFLERPLPVDATGPGLPARRDALLRRLSALELDDLAARLRTAPDASPSLGVLPDARSSGEPGRFAQLADVDRIGLDDDIEIGPSCTVADGAVTVGATTYRLDEKLVDTLRQLRDTGGRWPAGKVAAVVSADPHRVIRALVRAGVLRQAA